MEFEYKNFLFEVDCQWLQLFGKYNWYTFHLINFEVENDSIMGGYEVILVLLGFRFRARWNHTETEVMKKCVEAVKDIEERGIEEATIPFKD